MIGFGKGKDAIEKVFAAPDYDGPGTGAVIVEITQGQSDRSRSRTRWRRRTSSRAPGRSSGSPATIRGRGRSRPRTYTLRKQMSAKAALELMLNTAEVRSCVTRISFRAGLTKAEVSETLQKSKLQAAGRRRRGALGKPASLGLPSYAHNNAEGFLYPGTYDVPKGATAYTILKLMTAQYAKHAAELDLVKTAQRKKLDPYQAVIVASIIGAETNRPQDYAKVARVIYNRLRVGMKLQMDSTIHYVVGKDGEVFTTPEQREMALAVQHLQEPGPAADADQLADQGHAAGGAQPGAGVSWLYFTLVNLDTGETAFASTAEEHLANVKKLQAWCSAHTGRC